MTAFQMWLVATLAKAGPIRDLMHTRWGWPIAESLHFVGLTLLVGTIGLFDLRLLGLGRAIPIAAMHRLIRWGLVGFALNATTGSLFLMAEPDQYVYNPSFQFKLLFIALAGMNALAFYATMFRHTTSEQAPADAPLAAKLIAAVSLSLWIGVIIAGRLLTFYRPYPCEPPEPRGIATCIPGYSTPPVLGPSTARIQDRGTEDRNPRFGCPRIARIISQTFGVDIDKNVVHRVLSTHYRPAPRGSGPSWLSFIGHAKRQSVERGRGLTTDSRPTGEHAMLSLIAWRN